VSSRDANVGIASTKSTKELNSVIHKLREQQTAAAICSTLSAIGNIVVSFGVFDIYWFIQFIFMGIETVFFVTVVLSDNRNLRKRQQENSDRTGSRDKTSNPVLPVDIGAENRSSQDDHSFSKVQPGTTFKSSTNMTREVTSFSGTTG